MSLTTLFFGKYKETKYGYLTADVLIDESIDMPAEVANHPIELGSDISDNVYLKPIMIKASFFISDHHIHGGASENISRVSAAYEVLKIQRALRLPFAYVSALEVFPFCVATNISAPRSANDGDSITFGLSIQVLQIAPPFGLVFPANQISPEALFTVASMVTL